MGGAGGSPRELGACWALDHSGSDFSCGLHTDFHIRENSIEIQAYFSEVGL